MLSSTAEEEEVRNTSLDVVLQFCIIILFVCESLCASPTPVNTVYSSLFIFLHIHVSNVANYVNEEPQFCNFEGMKAK